MAQISIIFVCVFAAVFSISEASQFGFGTQMRMPGFQQMGMPGLGDMMMDMMLPMMSPMMPPMMLPRPPKQSKMLEMMKLQEKMRLEQIKQQEKMRIEQLKQEAKQHKLMMEQQKLMMQAAMMAAMKPKPKPIVVETPKPKSSKSSKSKSSKSKKSSSKKSDTSKISSSKSSKDSKSVSSKETVHHSPTLSMPQMNLMNPLIPGQMPFNPLGQMPLTGIPGGQFQGVSYSSSSTSSNINGIPSSSHTGQVTFNDNGKVTTHVF